MKFWKLMLIMALMAGLFAFAACDDDDDDDDTTAPVETIEDLLVGEWLSADENVAPLLTAYYDSVRVTFNDNNTHVTDSHAIDGNWAALQGTWSVVESESGNIHAIHIETSAYTQDGIVRVVDDVMTLEVIQTEPAVPFDTPTVEGGFGADATLGTTNIQTYVKQ